MENRQRILTYLGATEENWLQWKWQVENIFRKAESVSELISLRKDQLDSLRHAIHVGLPFGITPYYLSLMDRYSSDSDRAVRDVIAEIQKRQGRLSEKPVKPPKFREIEIVLENETKESFGKQAQQKLLEALGEIISGSIVDVTKNYIVTRIEEVIEPS